MEHFGTTWVAVVEAETLYGWLSREAVETALGNGGAHGSTVGELPTRPFGSRVSPATPLREALDVIINAHSRMAVVIESDGQRDRYLGMITIDEVAGGLES
jgi:CBS domain-containing protein